MNREDVRKLLGGYATGTLTPAEREALFAAALEDQELFDAMMKEEPLREMLEDPASKAAVLAALEPAPARPAWWQWRPLIGAVAMAAIALGVVAAWRANSSRPAPVTVAQVEERKATPLPASPPAASEEAPVKSAPPVAQPRQNVLLEPPAPSKAKLATKATEVADVRREVAERRDEPARAEALTDKGASQAKAEVQVTAAAPLLATPPPAVPKQQGQLAPSPATQQAVGGQLQTQTVELQAAPALSRAAINGFRAASGSGAAAMVKEASAGKEAFSALTWTILRGDTELPPETTLAAGDNVRLRITSMVAGTVTVREGEKVLGSSPVEARKPYDAPVIEFTAAGPRQLQITLASPPMQPLTLNVTLTWR